MKKVDINGTFITFSLHLLSFLLSLLYLQEEKLLGDTRFSFQMTEKWSPSKSPQLHSAAKDNLQFVADNTPTL